MIKRRRFVRCPQCNFEHLQFGEPRVGEDAQVITPWRCPHCGWWGQIRGDEMKKRPPPAEA